MLKKLRGSWVALASSALVLGAIFWILHRQHGFDDLTDIWGRSDKRAIGLAIVAMMVVHAMGAARLRVLMLADGIPRVRLVSIFRIQLVSQFAAYGAPISALADLARAAMVALRFGLSIGRAVRMIFYERICGALGAAVVGLVAVGIQFALFPTPILLGTQLILWIGGLIGAALLLSLGGMQVTTPYDLLNRLIRGVAMLGQMLRRPRVSLELTLIALFHMLSFGLVFAVLAAGMHIAVSPLQAILFAPLIFFVSSLPIFYLGWGAREIIVIATLGSSASISTAEAVALSVGVGVITFLTTLPGAGFWLLRPSMRKAIQETEAELSLSGFEQA